MTIWIMKMQIFHLPDSTRKNKISGLERKLKELIHPLDINQFDYHKELVDIYSGKIADTECNLHMSFEIGKR